MVYNNLCRKITIAMTTSKWQYENVLNRNVETFLQASNCAGINPKGTIYALIIKSTVQRWQKSSVK